MFEQLVVKRAVRKRVSRLGEHLTDEVRRYFTADPDFSDPIQVLAYEVDAVQSLLVGGRIWRDTGEHRRFRDELRSEVRPLIERTASNGFTQTSESLRQLFELLADVDGETREHRSSL